MSLRSKVFPETPPNDKIVARSKFVGSWESQLRGLGRHTAYLSTDLTEFRADVDDIAMDLVYLQRHRVEVGLKLVLERAGGEVPTTHDISDLRRCCLQHLDSAGQAMLAADFDAETREFVDLMHAADRGSYAYRYPVDTHNQPAQRAEYIDLAELESGGAAFQASVIGVVAALTKTVGVPVADEDVEATSQEAATTVRAMRATVAFLEATYEAMENDRAYLATRRGMPNLPISAEGGRARERADDQLIAMGTLEPPLLLLLDRLAPRRDPDAPPIALDAGLVPPPPPLTSAAVAAPGEHAKRRMIELAEGIARYFPPLKSALGKMLSRTASWSSEADRQLHADLERFHSRILVGVDPDAVAPQAGNPEA
jgi:hypothetical protein